MTSKEFLAHNFDLFLNRGAHIVLTLCFHSRLIHIPDGLGLGKFGVRFSSNYEATRQNLRLTKDTKVICQGFTGKQGTFHSQQAIEYGTRMVGGVSPGKGGRQHLDLPVFNSVSCAISQSPAVAYLDPPFRSLKLDQRLEPRLPSSTFLHPAPPRPSSKPSTPKCR